MAKNRIFSKLFFMTLSLAMAILLVQFVFQYFWLDDFYYYNKSRQAKTFIEELEQTLVDKDATDQEVDEAIRSGSEKYNSFVAVFNQYGEQYYGLYIDGGPYFTMLTDDHMVYKVYFDKAVEEEALIQALSVGKKIGVNGYVDVGTEKVILPEWLIVDGKEYGMQVEQIDLSIGLYDIQAVSSGEAFEIDNEIDSIYDDDLYLLDVAQLVEGTIVSLNTDQVNISGMAYKENKMFEEQFKVFASSQDIIKKVNENQYIEYESRDEYTGIKSLVSIKKVFDFYGHPLYVFSIMSLESIDEATRVTLSYYYITVVVALLLAVVFSYFYSRRITRPLLHLRAVTAKLAEVDFSTSCQVTSKDEIEDLANSINLMADRLEKTLKQLKQFLADASHELKTPLTVMQGIVEGLIDGVYDVNNPDHYALMQSEIKDMSQLVYDLLELSKLESGEVALEEGVFQISDVILKSHKKLGVLIKEKNLNVSLELDETFVRGNEAYIETVVKNFYTNAIRYTQEGGNICIRVTESNDVCHVSIENAPSHISEEALSQLWQPFFRMDPSRNKASGGTGLGLYMVKTILDRHNSHYDLRNTDQGVLATFSLKIEYDG